jgi:hypothetical protein
VAETPVGSGLSRAGWVQNERSRDDYSALARTGGHCAPVVQGHGSPRDALHQADCSDACSAGCSLAPRADDLPQDGWVANLHRDEYSAAQPADDLTANDHFSLPAGSDVLPLREGSAETAPAE